MNYIEIPWRNISCNECNCDEDVKVIKISEYNLILCRECREELSKLLRKK